MFKQAAAAMMTVSAALCGCGPADQSGGGSTLQLPEGFTATVFAENVTRARHIVVRDNGDVYVSMQNAELARLAEGPGGLMALRDEDGDGRADVQIRFGPENVDTGLAIYEGDLYYETSSAVYAIPLGDELVPTAEPELVVGGFPQQRSHAAKPLAFDGEGHLYVASGAPSNACMEQTRTPGSPGMLPCPQLEQAGGVWRFIAEYRDQDQVDDGVRFSTGHRHVVALEYNLEEEQLYLVMHGRDQLDVLWPDHYTADQRAELPAEEFHAVNQGDNLGWPYTYWDPIRGERMVMPEYGGDGETVAESGTYKDPLIGFPAHYAPDDLIFYTGDQFPERYRGGAFITFRGSWNRAPAEQGGYNVVFVPMEAGSPSSDWEVFADGFAGMDPIIDQDAALNRPVGLAEGPDGSLYITADQGDRIWKVSYEGN